MSKFYRIILQQDRKLMLSPKFVQRFGKKLSDFAILELPNGRAWKIRLQKQRNGEVWFREGWADFSMYYSIRRGTFLLFTYHGFSDGTNSHFFVQIFGMNAMEIDYSPANLSTASEEEEEEVSDDESESSIQIMNDQFPTNPNTGKAQHKNKARETETRPKSVPERKFQSSTTSQGNATFGKDMDKQLKKVEAIREKEACECKNPFFVVGVQRSYIYGRYMYVPSTFVEKHLRDGVINVELQTRNGKTWPALLQPRPKARFSGGWPEFRNDNNLKMGDVCVFELVNRNPFYFRVRIY